MFSRKSRRGRLKPAPRGSVMCRLLSRFLICCTLLLCAPLLPAPKLPVILISVDTLRADRLSCYGYRRLSTPNIDALAKGGTLFSQVSAQAPLTLPSHASLLTSTYPSWSGIKD